MASAKRELQPEEEVEPLQSDCKKARTDITPSNSPKPQLPHERVVLNPADCDLDFNIESDGLRGFALHEEGFGYCWSGVRANFGVTVGKYCFGCKVISAQAVKMEDTPPDQQHVCRIGISKGDDPVGKLGETMHSFGLGGTGKFSTAGKFSNYGEKFGIGDTIVCAVDLESKPLASIGFSKNGKWLGTAKEFDAGPKGLGVVGAPMRERQWESVFFPHVLLKNVVVQLQFSVEDGLLPEEGYRPWAAAVDDGNAIKGPILPHTGDCEVIMMVGLPASGKTTWAEKWMKEHPDRRYVLLGTNLILDQMKVPGLLRKHNYGERFDRLMGQANAIFDILLLRAARTPRNYIIDQTNVFKSARKRKLRPFANFYKIAVVVFPKPEELKFRADKRFKEMGKQVPSDVVNMLANYVLPMSKVMPGSDEFFDQVIFPELGRGESQKYLEEMKCTLNTNSTPYSRESSVASYPEFSPINQGALSVSGQWSSSHPSQPPPHPSNYGYQHANQVSHPGQGYDYAFRTSHCCQFPTNSRGPVPDNTFESCVPQQSSGYQNAIPGDRSVPYRSYGAVGPYSGPNFDGMNTATGAAAAFDPYKSNVVEPSTVGNMRSYSFRYSTVGDLQANLHAPRGPRFAPSVRPSSYGSHYGLGPQSMYSSPTPSPRPPYGNLPSGMMEYYEGDNPPPARYY